MNEIKVFENEEFGTVRGVEIDGESWLVGKDVAERLGYSNPRKAIGDHVDDEDKRDGVTIRDSMGREQMPTMINESGFYSLVLGSKMQDAKRFKRWVTHDVLPAIRKTGGYIAGEAEMTDEELLAMALKVMQNKLHEREARIDRLEQDNSRLTVEKQIMQPKADYFDDLVDRNLLTGIRETAKQLGVKEKEFVAFMIAKKYLYRDKKGKLMPCAEKNNGLFELKECLNEKTEWAGTQTMFTPKGRETFRLLTEGMRK